MPRLVGRSLEVDSVDLNSVDYRSSPRALQFLGKTVLRWLASWNNETAGKHSAGNNACETDMSLILVVSC